ncbi:MAG: hypothetical protein VW516_00045 [Rhodospirillaceae bacterium]|jgi:hypothetical protein
MSRDKNQAEQAAQAAPKDPMEVLLGRFSAFQTETSAALKAMAQQVEANTAALESMSSRFSELNVSAPHTPAAEQQPLTREQIEQVLAKNPSASFRLLQDVTYPSFDRTRGAIIRPQVLEPRIWSALLAMRVRMADADENP